MSIQLGGNWPLRADADNGRELCGRHDRQPYEPFLQLEGIEHRATRVERPQPNGIVERLHRTLLDERFRVEGRRTWLETIEEMQTVLDAYLVHYHTRRPYQVAARTAATCFSTRSALRIACIGLLQSTRW